jgi:hypothetical protein
VQTKNKLLFLLLFLALPCAGQSNIGPVNPDWAVFSSRVKWESPPPELHSKTKEGRARIRVFFLSGEYGEVFCSLIRQEDGSISISRGDREVVGKGTWKQDGDHVSVNSRIVYRTVVISGRPIPEAETTEHLTTAAKGRNWTVRDDKGRYVRLAQFGDWRYLASLIKCDREYFDGRERTDGIQPCAPQPEK